MLKIFVLQVRRLRIQQRIKSAELGIIQDEQENELPSFPSFIPFLPPLVIFCDLKMSCECYTVTLNLVLFVCCWFLLMVCDFLFVFHYLSIYYLLNNIQPLVELSEPEAILCFLFFPYCWHYDFWRLSGTHSKFP